MQRKIETIQVLRAVAALAVLIAHTRYQIGIVAGVENYPSLVTGAAGVDLFFVISGFVMVYTSEPLFAVPGGAQLFWRRRIARIVPLYWTITTILLAYFVIRFGSVAHVGQTVGGVIASYLFVPWSNADGPPLPLLAVGWTLNLEMFFYLLFGLAVVLPAHAAVGAISAFLIILATFGAHLPLPGAFGQVWTDSIILDFVYGMVLALVYRNGTRLPRSIAIISVTTGFCLVAGSAWWFPSEPRTLYWGVPSAMILAGCVSLESKAPASWWPWAAFVFLGDCSYALYLVHPIAQGLPRQMGIDFARSQPFVYSAFIIVFSVAAGIAVHIFYERPLNDLLRKNRRGGGSEKLRLTSILAKRDHG